MNHLFAKPINQGFKPRERRIRSNAREELIECFEKWGLSVRSTKDSFKFQLNVIVLSSVTIA